MDIPAIRISVVANPPGLLVEVPGKKREFTLPALRRLGALKTSLPGMLRAFRQSVGVPGVTLTSAEADQAVTDLDLCAAAIADQLIEGAPDFSDVDSFESALAGIIGPALRQAGQDQTPAIEIIEPQPQSATDPEIAGLLPAEFLRFAEPPPALGIAAPRDQRLQRYLGIRAATVRRYRETIGSDVIGGGQVPVAVLAYDGNQLRGPAKQAAFFRSQRKAFAGRYWPEGREFSVNDLSLSPVLPYRESELALSLSSELMAVTGLRGGAAEQQYNGCIVHFCCHYYTKELAEIDQSSPFLSFDDLRKNISVTALRGALASASNLTPAGRCPSAHFAQALVVLNACETAATAPFTHGILQFLLSRGFRHIIASETLVPDSLSSEFATYFYLALMRGETIGEGLRSARLTLVNLHDNPGGLLYTLYGDPDVRLAVDAGV
jgi:hypothetical protein